MRQKILAPPYKTSRSNGSIARLLLVPLFLSAISGGFAQLSTPLPNALGTAPAAPPKEIRLVEVPFDRFSEQQSNQYARKALELDPKRWKHAESPHFVLHYRRTSDGERVAKEAEWTLWFVAKTLNATPDRYAKRSHLWIFQDNMEWKQFIAMTNAPDWYGSFALGDDLFLNVQKSLETGRFNSETLAHEVTHAVIARLYPSQRWPLWLNEGFASYASGASIAGRLHQTVRSHQSRLRDAEYPLEELFKMEQYPSDEVDLARFYQTGEKLIRFLHNEMPADRFVTWLDLVLKGTEPKAAILQVYGDKVRDWNEFIRRFSRFTK